MSGAHVFVHQSQFPGPVQAQLLESLRTRRINPKFHYQTYKQAAKWLALHKALSPAQRDPSCISAYDDAFAAARAICAGSLLHVIGLGVGGGAKEARLLQLLVGPSRPVEYTPVDVGLALVLTALAAVESLAELRCFPVVCDILAADDLTEILQQRSSTTPRRLITLFGVVPNADAGALFARVRALMKPNDVLLLSANMAPGGLDDDAVQRILPQYDNPATRDWLMVLLRDLGIEDQHGDIAFHVASDPGGGKRIVATFQFHAACRVRVDGEEFRFACGESMLLFFSCRHTRETLAALLREHGFNDCQQWENATGEEAILLCTAEGSS